MPEDDQPETIEVGATPETGLRLWRAKEAMRQAEARLAFQAASLATMETRAQAVIGWAVAGATALTGGLLIADLHPPLRWAGAGALACLLLSAFQGISALRPGQWVQGGDARALMNSEYETELQEHEVTALGYADGIDQNNARLDRVAKALRVGLWLLAASPLAALVGAGAWYAAPRVLSAVGI